jgi:5-methylcytosine-specific restriction endonuclease McrA
MCLEKDNHTCIKCGSKHKLVCHHIEGIQQNPLESVDLDMVVTVCKKCHKEIHSQEGCKYHELQCKE